MDGTVSTEQKRFIKEDLLEPLRHYFQNTLQVKRNPNGVQFSSSTCYEASTPGGVNEPNADMVIFVTAANAPTEGYIAWATSCSRDQGSMRPNVGQIHWNLESLKHTATGHELYNQVSTGMHELTHALGFANFQMDYFQDANLNTVSKASIVGPGYKPGSFEIISPRVV